MREDPDTLLGKPIFRRVSCKAWLSCNSGAVSCNVRLLTGLLYVTNCAPAEAELCGQYSICWLYI
jgi:hypothetical protein